MHTFQGHRQSHLVAPAETWRTYTTVATLTTTSTDAFNNTFTATVDGNRKVHTIQAATHVSALTPPDYVNVQ